MSRGRGRVLLTKSAVATFDGVEMEMVGVCPVGFRSQYRAEYPTGLCVDLMQKSCFWWGGAVILDAQASALEFPDRRQARLRPGDVLSQ